MVVMEDLSASGWELFPMLRADVKPEAQKAVRSALAAAHALPVGRGGKGGVHGDARPANVYLRLRDGCEPLAANFDVRFM
jgi:hypothetical protein